MSFVILQVIVGGLLLGAVYALFSSGLTPNQSPTDIVTGSNGWLYFTANELERQAQFHGGHDLRQRPYTLFRVKIGGNPVALK